MTSRNRLLIGAAVVAVLVAIVLAVQSMMTPPSDLDLARSKATAGGLYVAAIEPDGGTVVQNELHAWTLTVTTPAGEAVTGATIGVDGGMPQHGHGLPTAPAATELGGGRYRIDGVRFNMSGWWELKFSISAAQGKDDVVFNLSL
ncbi:MAG: FixH family protein [Rhizobiaceae bacterium]|nr:FixH family protein [Rhizobiaceae bacterium]